MLKLFVSYAPQSQRKYANELKVWLADLGIDAFVAHDDIQPTAEWRAELLRSLQGADAALFLADPESIKSPWCNQEIGVAIGAEKFVVAMLRGATPPGFASDRQGIRSVNDNAKTDARAVYDVLVNRPEFRLKMATGLAHRLLIAGSFSDANSVAEAIGKHPAFSKEAIDIMEKARVENAQVREAFDVPNAIANAKTKVISAQ